MDLPTVACELRNRFDGTVKFQTRVKIMVLLKCPEFLEKEGDGKDVSPCTALRDGNHHLSAVLGWFMKGEATESVERYVLQRHLPFLQSIDRASLNQFW